MSQSLLIVQVRWTRTKKVKRKGRTPVQACLAQSTWSTQNYALLSLMPPPLPASVQEIPLNGTLILTTRIR
jgi:hypothetical protein